MRRSALLLAILVLAPGYGAAQALPCRPEAALDAMAQAVVGRRALGAAEVQAALRAAGSDLPGARVLRGTAPALGRALRRLAASEDAPLVCGLARSAADITLVVAPRAGRLEPTAGGLRVALADGFEDGYVAFRGAEGGLVRRRALHGRMLAWPEVLRAPRVAQLVASGPEGPRPVALREEPGAGSPPVAAPSAEPSGDDVLAGVASLRRREGVLPLRDNRLLRAAALRHATRVCAAGRARHGLGAGDDPRRRLRAEHIEARHVGEVVARGASRREAFAGLLASPSHRAALVDRRFTDVGVAEAQGDGGPCVVIVLAAWPRVVGASAQSPARTRTQPAGPVSRRSE
ncbi:MAG: CAP domain-containing protein [Myxococcota bacterium]